MPQLAVNFGLVIRRLILTLVLASLVASVAAVFYPEAVGSLLRPAAFVILVPLWIALVITWTHFSPTQKVDIPKSPVPRAAAPKRPLGVRFLRGVGKLALALFILLVVPQIPLAFTFYHAQSARRTLRVGMTEDEVLRSVTGWNAMQVLSHPSGVDQDIDEVSMITFGAAGKGVYTLNDYGRGDGRQISETEALTMIGQKTQGSDHWSFLYIYRNFVQSVHFSVAFGADGRVTEIRPVGEPLS